MWGNRGQGTRNPPSLLSGKALQVPHVMPAEENRFHQKAVQEWGVGLKEDAGLPEPAFEIILGFHFLPKGHLSLMHFFGKDY